MRGSAAVAASFPTALEMANADVKRWMEVEGIGKTGSEQDSQCDTDGGVYTMTREDDILVDGRGVRLCRNCHDGNHYFKVGHDEG